MARLSICWERCFICFWQLLITKLLNSHPLYAVEVTQTALFFLEGSMISSLTGAYGGLGVWELINWFQLTVTIAGATFSDMWREVKGQTLEWCGNDNNQRSMPNKNTKVYKKSTALNDADNTLISLTCRHILMIIFFLTSLITLSLSQIANDL